MTRIEVTPVRRLSHMLHQMLQFAAAGGMTDSECKKIYDKLGYYFSQVPGDHQESAAELLQELERVLRDDLIG